jgi:hypothetical protein
MWIESLILGPRVMMKALSRSLKPFLIAFSVFWVLILPDNLYFSSIGDLDNIFPYICFQQIDQADSSPGPDRNENIFEPTLFQENIPLPFLLAGGNASPLDLIPGIISKSPILRC